MQEKLEKYLGKSKTFTENWDSKAPSVGTLLKFSFSEKATKIDKNE